MTVWLTALLVFSRMGGLLMSMPVVSAAGVPKHVQVLGAVALTAVLTPVVPGIESPDSVGALILASGSEVGIGLLMGFIVSTMFGALHLATELMSVQAGFGMAAMFNPFAKATGGPLGSLAGWLAALGFLSLGLHHDLLILLGESFQLLPAGQLVQPGQAAPVVIELTGNVILLGVQLAGPVILLVWLLNIFVAVLTRLAPRMNVYFSVGTLMTPIAAILLFSISLPWLLEVHMNEMAGSLEAAAAALHMLSGG